MGMDLLGEKQKFRLNWSGWTDILELANNHGWKPKGTKAPKFRGNCKNWDGSYFCNSWQLVTKKDAENIAAALKKALKEMPLDRRQKENRKVIKEFIDFCESGSFIIA